jgi:hypothetical protein
MINRKTLRLANSKSGLIFEVSGGCGGRIAQAP